MGCSCSLDTAKHKGCWNLQPCEHLDCSPGRLILGSDLHPHERMHACCLNHAVCVLRHGNHRRLMHSQDPGAPELGDRRTARCLWPLESRPPLGSTGLGRLSVLWFHYHPEPEEHAQGCRASLGNGRSLATRGPGRSAVGPVCAGRRWPCVSSAGSGSRHRRWPRGVEVGLTARPRAPAPVHHREDAGPRTRQDWDSGDFLSCSEPCL